MSADRLQRIAEALDAGDFLTLRRLTLPPSRFAQRER